MNVYRRMLVLVLLVGANAVLAAPPTVGLSQEKKTRFVERVQAFDDVACAIRLAIKRHLSRLAVLVALRWNHRLNVQ